MMWEPFALAIAFGLMISSALYFIVMWPQVEPLEGDELDGVDDEAEAALDDDAVAG